MLSQHTGKKNYWEAIKWQLYIDSVPEQMKDELKTETFEKLKNVQNLNDELDIIIDSLIHSFIFDDTIKKDNVNLYGTSRDLCRDLIQF